MANSQKHDQEVDESHSYHDEEPQKNQTDHKLVDKEVAKYATDTAIHIDEATNKRLRRNIHKRILVVMMVTYLIQTLDKGAMSFASIMGIVEDANLAGNQVRYLKTSSSSSMTDRYSINGSQLLFTSRF